MILGVLPQQSTAIKTAEVIYTIEIFLRFFVNGPCKSLRDHWVKFDTILVAWKHRFLQKLCPSSDEHGHSWLVLWILPATGRQGVGRDVAKVGTSTEAQLPHVFHPS